MSTDATYDNSRPGDTRQGNWMQTYSGKRFWPVDPRAEEVSIVDIAHALGKICRFNGHCTRFYSVAQHSVIVSQVVPEEDALAGLLHDATEAYIGDVIRPLKPYLPGYVEIERKVWHAIADAFGLSYDLPDSVKRADNTVLMREAETIMVPPPEPWNVPFDPEPVIIGRWDAEKSTNQFLARFHDLTGSRITQKGI